MQAEGYSAATAHHHHTIPHTYFPQNVIPITHRWRHAHSLSLSGTSQTPISSQGHTKHTLTRMPTRLSFPPHRMRNDQKIFKCLQPIKHRNETDSTKINPKTHFFKWQRSKDNIKVPKMRWSPNIILFKDKFNLINQFFVPSLSLSLYLD